MDDKTRKATVLWISAQPVVAASAASVIRDVCDRDDVRQETAIAVFDSVDSCDSTRPFNAWAIGVARNRIGLYLTLEARKRLRPLPAPHLLPYIKAEAARMNRLSLTGDTEGPRAKQPRL